uniref:DNA 5'-3' helicase n=1 Tax=Bartheletia paradoxa TaxID=669517 RepID=A0A2D0XI73_9BASI|nr:hypothetical protein SPAR02645 [Bartheletia paradoxa]
MKFMIDNLPVIFPYDKIYPEQYSYMCDLKHTLDAGGHCVLEMPSGTGKTVSLLSLIVSYQQFFPTKRKLIYCSRTVPEIEKALAELKRLMAYRKEAGVEDGSFLGLGLTSRKNLCLHPTASKEKKGKVVDSRCRDMTSSFELGKLEPGNLIPDGIWTLDQIKTYGKEKGICPYFAVRRMMPFADVIIYSFHYLLDPKVAEQVSKEISDESIVVFDEAHNIDNVCIESLSIDVNRPMLDSATRSVDKLTTKIVEMKATDASKLQDEYAKLVEGLQGDRENADGNDDSALLSNPVLPDDLLNEAIPGNIRKAEHFVAFLKRFIEYLKTRMRVLHVVAETPLSFLQHLKDLTFIERKPLRFCADRLSSLLTRKFYSPRSCLDASLAIKPIFDRFSSVVITSGTISPMDMYPKMLQFEAVVMESYPMSLSRNCFLPLVITRGSDQVAISSRFEVRNDPAVVRNFGSILIEYSRIVPDGVVAFFPSYLYMETIVSAWNEMGILNEVWKNKLIFVETPDALETSIALENYRRACDNGRGAVLLSVARGKVSEGIDFDNNYGRAVIMFGIPYQYTESRILKARLEFLRDTYRIRENDFLTFDALRHAAQCVGRVLRSKVDYGIMVFADKRFARADKRSKLPRWINAYITETCANLSTDMAISTSKHFLKNMGQPFDQAADGISLWGLEDVEAKQASDAAKASAMEYDAPGQRTNRAGPATGGEPGTGVRRVAANEDAMDEDEDDDEDEYAEAWGNMNEHQSVAYLRLPYCRFCAALEKGVWHSSVSFECDVPYGLATHLHSARPRVPLELQYYIISLAVRLPASPISLMQVCRTWHDEVTSVLYRSISVQSGPPLWRLIGLEHGQGLKSYGDKVQEIEISRSTDMQQFEDLLTLCPNLHTIRLRESQTKKKPVRQTSGTLEDFLPQFDLMLMQVDADADGDVAPPIHLEPPMLTLHFNPRLAVEGMLVGAPFPVGFRWPSSTHLVLYPLVRPTPIPRSNSQWWSQFVDRLSRSGDIRTITLSGWTWTRPGTGTPFELAAESAAALAAAAVAATANSTKAGVYGGHTQKIIGDLLVRIDRLERIELARLEEDDQERVELALRIGHIDENQYSAKVFVTGME